MRLGSALSFSLVAFAFPALGQTQLGHFDAVSSLQNTLHGWACDPGRPNLPVAVHVYATNHESGHCFDHVEQGQSRRLCIAAVFLADQPRESAVANLCGGTSNHGFSGHLPAALIDERPHQLFAFPVDPVTGWGGVPGPCGIELCGSPRDYRATIPSLPPVTGLPVVNGRIGVRQVNGYGQLYNLSTGLTFVPRGNNYVRLVPNAAGIPWHSTFTPGRYNASAVESALAQMQSDRYNVVRVFLDHLRIGGSLTAPGLDAAYLANVRDFIVRARGRGLRTILTPTALPPNYSSIVNAIPLPANIGSTNTMFLHRGYIAAYASFVADLARQVRLWQLESAVFSYDVWNEPHYFTNAPPFSLRSGTVQPASGGSYDLSSWVRRQALADDGARYWANQIASALKNASPGALATASVFTPLAVGRSGYDGGATNADPRLPMRLTALANSALDYVDLHVYAQPGAFAAHAASAELASVNPARPIIFGELGVFRGGYPDVVSSALALRDLQTSSCVYRVSGWLTWTWDSWEQPEIWNALDHAGAINGVMAPLVRANSCVP